MAVAETSTSRGNGVQKRNNWRGKQDAAAGQPKHRWQQNNVAQATTRSSARVGGGGYVRFVMMATLFVGLFAYMIYMLLQVPPVTPLVLVEATHYHAPLSPRAFIAEESRAFESLDHNSVKIERLAVDGKSTETREAFRETLAKAAQHPAPSVIVYLNMHTAVTGDGVPCLIPPGANPLDDATWLSLSQLLDDVAATTELNGRQTLVVVDGARRASDWKIGQLYNTFADRAGDVCRDRGNISLLLANSTGEQSWVSPEMQTSVFGHYFRLGLAGFADESEHGGNNDRVVSTRELQQYVVAEVSRWAQANRAAKQTPMLIGDGDLDDKLTTALNGLARRRLKRQAETLAKSEAVVSSEQMNNLWSTFDNVADDRTFLRTHPHERSALANELIRLEQLRSGGAAYVKEAKRLSESLEVHLHRAENDGDAGWVPKDTVDRSGYFAELATRYQVDVAWENSGVAKQAMTFARDAEQVTALYKNGRDERVFGDVQSELDALDSHRRSVQDLLLIGRTAQSRLEIQLTTASKILDDVQTKIASATEQRARDDRTLATTTYLSQWLTNPARSRVGITLQEERELINDVAAGNDNFIAAFQTHCTRLLKAAPSAANVNAIESALHVPLIDSNVRSQLRKAFTNHSNHLHQQFVSGLLSTKPNDGGLHEVTRTADYAAWWASLPSNPAFASLRIGETKESQSGPSTETFDHDGATIRQHLLSVENEVQARAATTLSNIAEVERVIQDSLDRDRQSLLLWHASRAIDDFWGPRQAGEVPVFVARANAFVDAANKLRTINDRAVWTQKISARQRASQDLFTIRPTSRVVVPDSEGRVRGRLQIGVRSKISGASAVVAFNELTDARISAFEVDGVVAETRGAAVLTGPINSPDGLRPSATHDDVGFEFPMLSAPANSDGSSRRNHVRIAIVFRGHESSAEIGIGESRGLTTTTIPQHDRTTRVAVTSESPNLSMVVLIDGSQSMSERTAGASTSKADVARTVTNELLMSALHDRVPTCGVLAYGHRVGWSVEDSEKRLVQSFYQARVPAGLMPARDVEQILPLGRMTEADVSRTDDALSHVVGWGQSPHYFALQEAIRLLGPASDDETKAIFWISDGDRFSPSSDRSPLEDAGSYAELSRLATANNVQIHLLSLGQVDAEDAPALRQLTEATGGSLRSIAEAAMLLSDLVKSANGGRFEIRKAVSIEASANESHDVSAKPLASAQLGGATTFIPEQGANNFAVRVGGYSQRLRLRGGEFVDLSYSSQQQRLLSKPFERDFAVSMPLTNADSKPLSTRVFVHRVSRDKDVATFRISLQSDEFNYVPRPAETWVEVTPMLDAETPDRRSYYFYDDSYNTSAPVAMLRLTANDWPTQATSASVRVLTTQAATPPVFSWKLNEGIGADSTESTQQQPLPGVYVAVESKLTNGRRLLRISEQHEASATFATLRLRVTDVLPTRVTRHFDRDNLTITHNFELPTTDEGVLKRGSIEFTELKSMRENETRQSTASPIVVDVPSAADVL